MLTITKKQARRFLLNHQRLDPPRRLTGKNGILKYIRKVGCIQFDPLNIVGRNADLVLQSRVTNYQPQMLAELLYEDRSLIDGFDKNMSIYPVQDWPYFARRRQNAREYYGDPERPANSVIPFIRQEIRDRGPLSSIDIDLNKTVDWSWSPTRIARAALESMYFWGELIVHHKVNTRKVYDFTENHLSPDLISTPDPNQTIEKFQDWYVCRRIGSIGLMWDRAGDAWLGMTGIKSRERRSTLKRLIDSGELLEVEVDGVDKNFYVRDIDREILDRSVEPGNHHHEAAILAPLDNLLWDRRLIQEIFGFNYVWEVYKPAAERQFGYYVLPILYGDQFVARFEPVKDQSKGLLVVKNWWWEEGVYGWESARYKEMKLAVKKSLQQFLAFLSLERLEVDCSVSNVQGVEWLADL